MKSEWREYLLGEIYNFSSGLSKNSREFGFGKPFLSFKTVFNNYILPEELPDLVNSNTDEQERCSIMKGDVFLTRTSETLNELGMSSVALRDYPEATFNGFTKRLRPKGKQIYPLYVAYYMRSPYFRANINSMASMTTRASLNNDILSRLPIQIPTYEEQEKIGDILYSFDKKIKLNNRINENLEQQAKAIFQNELLSVQTLPAGWKQASLIDIADYLNGLTMQKYRPEDGEIGIPVLKIKELRQGCCDDSSELCSPNIKSDYIVRDGDVVFSWSGSLLVDFWCGGTCGLNQHLFKVTSAKYDKWFYYAWTKHRLDRFIAVAADKATTMGHIKRDELAKATVLIPAEADYKRIRELIQPVYDLIIANRIENKRLAEIRDILLPKLMSGEIDVSNIQL